MTQNVYLSVVPIAQAQTRKFRWQIRFTWRKQRGQWNTATETITTKRQQQNAKHRADTPIKGVSYCSNNKSFSTLTHFRFWAFLSVVCTAASVHYSFSPEQLTGELLITHLDAQWTVTGLPKVCCTPRQWQIANPNIWITEAFWL
jgi:hypothetical protein